MNDLKVPFDENTVKRFFSKIKKGSGCWQWLASKNSHGYGQFWIKELNYSFGAHRYSYLFHKGEIKEGLCLDHLCRNRECTNPDHLEMVTNRENGLRGIGPIGQNYRKIKCKYGHVLAGNNLIQRYHKNKGHRVCTHCAANRARKVYWQKRGVNIFIPDGELKSRTFKRLDAKQVNEIRKLITEGFFQKEIAKKYSVDQTTISNIKRGITHGSQVG